MKDGSLRIFSAPTARWFEEKLGGPTQIQKEAWPAIAAGNHTLVSAPTGTGKTLSAFLVFIDRLKAQALEGTLKQELVLIYISPLKSLAGDIRENLNKPLMGIDSAGEQMAITVGIRTGDTPQNERRRMIKQPPHILITTPESLYLMLTSGSGQSILKTAQAVIIDELHAMIDTKRGAHLMLSIARLDKLCGRNLQRIGLSATIEPLAVAAAYLAPEKTVIASPAMKKEILIEVNGAMASGGRRKDPVWEDLGAAVYKKCLECRSVIVFAEARRYAEKIAYYVNRLGGEDFARVHHGSLSKEQRAETEEALRSGKLRLLCATSSMELGIDVGDIDQVLQVGCPRTVSGTMQRLGRAGHSPNRVSVMYMYPRTAMEALQCAMTAQVAREGGVEHAKPPRLCLDVLAQHLVSMAQGGGYEVEEVLPVLKRAYPFTGVTKEDIERLLCMLAGDYEHEKEIPVRPRILYDRIHGKVEGDVYSRMLAVAAGGTIPDKGLYTVKTEEGVKLGELDEEFIYESYLGDRFVLGAFAWKIVRQDKDSVIVTQAPVEGARLPFWKGETGGRGLQTSLSFGRILRKLGEAYESNTLGPALRDMGMDEAAGESVEGLLKRQITAAGCLPDDKTILVEHFKDQNGVNQVMVHALFGRRVNTPLSLLVQHTVREMSGINLGGVDDEGGFLLYPYGDDSLPEGILYQVNAGQARAVLEAMLPGTPVFGITFRYNAARALMMGIKSKGRQPLWLQRLRSTQMLDNVIQDKEHPIVRETRRECLEEQWDIEGVMAVLGGIHAGTIAVREIYLDVPSPMSLPLQWQVEAAEMYEYTPATQGIREAVNEELKYAERLKPSAEELSRVQERRKQPEDEKQLHALLMMEGDMLAGELEVPVEWLTQLARQELALYREPGLWIAAEHAGEYDMALGKETEEHAEEMQHIIRRLLYYRGPHSAEEIAVRYDMAEETVQKQLAELTGKESVVEDGDVYYHAKLYDRARNNTVRSMRQQAVTQPPERFAALMAKRARINAPAEEQLKETIDRYCGKIYPVAFWESILLPGRVKNYSEAMLDRLLGQGEYYWQMDNAGGLCFKKMEDIDWESDVSGDEFGGPDSESFESENGKRLQPDEVILYRELCKRGASFLQALNKVPLSGDAQAVLLQLAEKGLVCADSFVPVRQWLNQDKIKKATVRQRVNSRVKQLSAGRWDIVRPGKAYAGEALLDRLLSETVILCRETFRQAMDTQGESEAGQAISWSGALEILRIWEYTGQVRRGYFIAGMSGAQFVRGQAYGAVMSALLEEKKEICWLVSTDPAQVWGKALAHKEGRAFLNVPGTAVALQGGETVAVMERQGKILRVFEEEGLEEVLRNLVQSFQRKVIFGGLNRLVVKEYPASAAASLKAAGFQKEMQDFVLYR